MKLLNLIGVLLPLLYGRSNAAKLGYPGDIASFDFSWSNPDRGGATQQGGSNGAVVSDGDTSTGEELTNPIALWGKEGTTVGMQGTFTATKLNAPSGEWWKITFASVTFTATQAACFSGTATGHFEYVDVHSGKTVALAVEITAGNEEITYSANIGSKGILTTGALGFTVATNAYCSEAEIFIVEFALEGEADSTPEPTTSPPTAKPTMSPTGSCTGHITWGDPHFHPLAVAGKSIQLNYQGYGWHYLFFPCDSNLYQDWPFFFLSDFDKWNSRTTITVNNMLILNTKPDPWIIEFEQKQSFTNKNIFKVTVGTDPVLKRTSADITKAKNKVAFTNADPLIIEYNDEGTPQQSGELRIYLKRGLLYVELYDVQYDAFPRTCDKGQKSGAECGEYICDGQTVQIANKGYTTILSCPTCFRNIGCGLMGKYTRGDCTKKMLKDTNSECSQILVGSDGEVNTPVNDKAFGPFAKSWHKDVVDGMVQNKFGSKPQWSASFSKAHGFQGRAAIGGSEGRVDWGEEEEPQEWYGECATDDSVMKAMNETCRLNTVVKYDACCQEIGLCDSLWKACTYDLCSCTDGGHTEQECLDVIVHESMNTTCNYDGFYPTDAPTTAPTAVPTRYVAPKEKVTKAQKLIWLYMVFVLLFVAIAIGAFCYYKKKSTKLVIVPDDDDDLEDLQGVETYTQA